MAIRTQHEITENTWFITFTCYKWLPLFELTQSYDAVYKWFDILKAYGLDVIGYVIMPNHIHALIAYMPGEKSINTVVGNGKRFLAYEIVDKFKAQGNKDMLQKLADGVWPSDRRKGKLHEAFEPSFECKLCYNQKFVNQKLSYIHGNPVDRKSVV